MVKSCISLPSLIPFAHVQDPAVPLLHGIPHLADLAPNP